MLNVLFLATLALATPSVAPISVNFTKDSVYKYESIITPTEVKEQENGLYTIVLEEDKLLGYQIYDNPETAYVDGLKFDDEFVTNYVITDVDFNVEHTILVKTVYTDDVAGMLMAAKNGDWSRVLSNPLIVLQLIYYILAAISVVVGVIIAVKGKSKGSKTVNEFGIELNTLFNTKVSDLSTNLQDALINLVTSLTLPMYTEMQAQNKDLLSALILSQSGDENAKLALIDLLKNSASKDVNLLSEEIKNNIRNANLASALLKSNAENTIKEIANGNFGTEPKQCPVDDGTSI